MLCDIVILLDGTMGMPRVCNVYSLVTNILSAWKESSEQLFEYNFIIFSLIFWRILILKLSKLHWSGLVSFHWVLHKP